MKKVWIGVGIGCGGLVVLGLVAIFAGGLFLKHKAEQYGGAITAASKSANEQQKALAALDAKYPFTPPPAGQVLKLEEPRLQAYLAVREGALPVYKDFEAKSKSLNEEYKNAGKARSIQGGLEAMGMLQDFFNKVRAAYVKGLEDQKMSPREFGAITGAIYASSMAGASDRRAELDKSIAQLEKQAASAPPDQKATYEQQVQMMKQVEASLPAAHDEASLNANAALVAKYQDRIKASQNPAFDAFTGTAGEEMGKQLGAAMGKSKPSDEGGGE